ncbi:hypothetical protein RRF57_004264 [Xylaria bambusicola]|uniref:Uncharacterized protein n=1 Tax=Xylaria bambusicola TaxID=326684 RepID=A0AAN7UVY0_9PEZI
MKTTRKIANQFGLVLQNQVLETLQHVSAQWPENLLRDNRGELEVDIGGNAILSFERHEGDIFSAPSMSSPAHLQPPSKNRAATHRRRA